MPSKQPGLFDNPSGLYSLDDLTGTVRALEREDPGRPADELACAVFDELGMRRTQRAAGLVAEAIRVARPRKPRAEIEASPRQAGTREVREWAAAAGFELDADGGIPGSAIFAYNQLHPHRPY